MIRLTFDMIIQGGVVVDGTGAPGVRADVGVVGDRIEAVGDLSGADARRVWDAAGKVVCPGFIDVHVHSELALLGGPDQYAPLRMGVTTQLASPDGFAWAPMSASRLREQKQYLSVFYDDALIDADADTSIETWLSAYKGRLPSNLALQVPHGSIRVETMGWDDRPADEGELRRMEGMVREWMEAGARAFCTGLEYEPMRRADLRELVHLAKVTAGYGGVYVAHQRGYNKNIVRGCRETFAIAKQADIPVHISHLPLDPGTEEQIEQARSEGCVVTFDMYPYRAGSTHLLLGLPAEVQCGEPDEVKERIRRPGSLREHEEFLEQSLLPDKLRFSSVASQRPMGWEGKTLREAMRELGMSLPDAVREILLLSDFKTLMIYHWADERYPALERTLRHPLHMFSTDGIYVGPRPHPRGFGTYPKVLGRYVRDKKWLGLEQAVYKMTGFPASVFQIRQRGRIARHCYADIVVFDPAAVGSRADYEQPRQHPDGIDGVLVNGQLAVYRNESQPGRFGRVLDG